MDVGEVSQLARRSGWHSSSSQSPRCLFCGSGTPWFDRGQEPGCSCGPARAIREGKLSFQLIDRGGKLVISKCSPELWKPLIYTGILVGALKAVMGKELPEESRQAMYAAGAAFKAENQRRETEPPKTAPPEKLSQKTEPPVPKTALRRSQPLPKTEPPSEIGSREQKRQRVLAQILIHPDKSDRAIAEELGISRNTVAAIRKMAEPRR